MAVLQEWEGHVSEVNGDVFTAVLYDLTQPDDHLIETAEFPIASLPEEERKYVQPGAFFRWRITDEEKSEIEFSKVCWTQEELDRADKEAKELFSALFGLR